MNFQTEALPKLGRPEVHIETVIESCHVPADDSLRNTAPFKLMELARFYPSADKLPYLSTMRHEQTL